MFRNKRSGSVTRLTIASHVLVFYVSSTRLIIVSRNLIMWEEPCNYEVVGEAVLQQSRKTAYQFFDLSCVLAIGSLAWPDVLGMSGRVRLGHWLVHA